MDIKALKAEMERINFGELAIFLDTCGYSTCESSPWRDHEEIEFDKKNPNEVYMAQQYASILDKMYEIYNEIEYLARPVKYMGKLNKNKNKRYQLNKDYEFYSGRTIEVFLGGKWYLDRIEYRMSGRNGGDEGYYLFGHPNIPLDGLKARARE